MTILDLVRIMRANLKFLILAMLVGVLLAAGYTYTRPVVYSATSTAQVTGGNSQDMNSATISEQLATSRAAYYSKLMGSVGVNNRILNASKGSLKPGDFSVSGSVPDGSATLSITATGSNPSKVQQAANLAPAALRGEAHYLETLGSDSKTTVYQVFPLTTAAKPTIPISPNWPINLAAGAGLGLLVGVAIVALRKQLDSRVRHTNELEKITNEGVLGVIPKTSNLQNRRRGGLGELGNAAEAFRMLRTNLRYVSPEQPPRSLVVTSAAQGEGKSTVASNLARVLSAAGQSVILVDTDLRRPAVQDAMDVENLVGLTEVLTGQVDLASAIQQGEHKNLAVLTSGRIPPNPSELLGSRRMSAVIEALSEEYMVIMDAPPLLPVTDAGLLAVAADGAVVVYHHSRTHREQVALCAKILDQLGANYFGSVLNMTPPKQLGSTIYGYGAGNYTGAGYGYGGYGASDDSGTPTAPTPAPNLDDLDLHKPGQSLPGKENAPDRSTHADKASATQPPEAARSTLVDAPRRGRRYRDDEPGSSSATERESAQSDDTAEPPLSRAARRARRESRSE